MDVIKYKLFMLCDVLLGHFIVCSTSIHSIIVYIIFYAYFNDFDIRHVTGFNVLHFSCLYKLLN